MPSTTRLLSAVTIPVRRGASAARRRLGSEAGFAVPTVLLLTVAALGMAGVATMTSIQGQSGTVRDQGAKSALAVAESGVSQALLHYNRGVAPCVPATEGEWCGPVEGMAVSGGAINYWARVLDGAAECGVGNEVTCVEVVSVGSFGGVTRRVDVMASTLPPSGSGNPGPFATASVLSKESMDLDANAEIHTGTATNGNLTLKSQAKLCGPASVGIGKELDNQGNGGWFENVDCSPPTMDPEAVAEAELTLPLVDQLDAATANDNDRLFAKDQISGKKADACWGGKDGNGADSNACGKERELLIDNASAVTLGGSIYSFCKLTLNSNGALYVESGTRVTIYFDSPEECGYDGGAYQLELLSNSRITSAKGGAVDVAMMFVGSETRQTRILLNSNTEVDGPCEQNFIIYAPLSDVELASKSRFCGAIAGKSVHLSSNAQIWSASGSDDFKVPEAEVGETVAHYTSYRFVECSPAPPAAPSAPNDGC